MPYFQYIYLNTLAAQLLSPEVDVVVLQRLRNVIDQQREQIRIRERDLQTKIMEIESVSVNNLQICD